MKQTFIFHVCCKENVFRGEGSTCFEAAANALGTKRATSLAKNTTQTKYCNGNVEASAKESGVSNFISRNGLTIASVTRLV